MKRTQFDTAFGSYRVIRQIGQGGAGTAYEVVDEADKRLAVKCLDPNKITKAKLKRFKNELFFCLRNTHRNIITVLDFGLAKDKAPFYVMPYYPNTLRKLMQAGIPRDQVLPLFSQILDGIEAAHLLSVWHRDLKPENILHAPDAKSLVIADFGIAHFTEEQRRTTIETKPGDRLANFQYAAPEQCPPTRLVDHRVDIYALGLILNEMFTAQVPRGADYPTVEQIAPEYAYLDELIQSMIQHSPKNRPASIDAIKQQLNARGLEFVVKQKLNDLKRTVVPHSEIDDPLVVDPPQLVGIDYRSGALYLELSQPVHSEWINVFYDMHIRYAPMEMTLRRYFFDENQVHINVGEGKVQQAVNVFKEYLEQANREYGEYAQRIQRQKEDEECRQLEARIQEEETRKQILESVRI